MKGFIKSAIIGGTDAWFGISNDEEHMIDSKDPNKGYMPTQNTDSEDPYGPFLQLKGNMIEKAMLEFLVDNDEDVE